MSDVISRLYATIMAERGGDPQQSRTARLLAEGMPKIAKKLAEEAVEVALEAAQGDRGGLVMESVDLIYNLCVAWAHAGIAPEEIWAEMERRERMLGIAGKLPKAPAVSGFAAGGKEKPVKPGQLKKTG